MIFLHLSQNLGHKIYLKIEVNTPAKSKPKLHVRWNGVLWEFCSFFRLGFEGLPVASNKNKLKNASIIY